MNPVRPTLTGSLAPVPAPKAAPAAPASPAVASASLALLGPVREVCATVLRADAATLEIHMPFSDLGMDSILAGEAAKRLSDQLGQPVKPTEIFNHPTVAKLADHLQGLQGHVSEVTETPPVPETALTEGESDPLMELLERIERGELDIDEAAKALERLA